MTVESIVMIILLSFIILQLIQVKLDILAIKQNQLPMIQNCCEHRKKREISIENRMYKICDVCGFIEECV